MSNNDTTHDLDTPVDIRNSLDCSNIYPSLDSSNLEVLPVDVRNGKQAIGKDDLNRIYMRLFGDSDNKQFDSDDSLISEIDNMDAEELARETAKFRMNFENVDRMKTDCKMIESILAVGKRGKRILNNHTSGEESMNAEDRKIKFKEVDLFPSTSDQNTNVTSKKQRVVQNRKKLPTPKGPLDDWIERNGIDKNDVKSSNEKVEMEQKKNKRKEEIVQVFEQSESGKYMTCSEFSNIIDIFAELVVGKKKVKLIGLEEIEERLKFNGVRVSFYTGELSAPEFFRSMIHKILKNKKISYVFCGDKYGFGMTNEEALQALRRYYAINVPENDNGKSVEPLFIGINRLVQSCYSVKKENDKSYQPNDAVKKVVLVKY